LKLVKDSLLYVTGTVSPILVQLLVTPLLTRLLGGHEYGNVAIGIAISQSAAVILPLGLSAAITRHVILEDGGGPEGARIVTAGATITLFISAAASLLISAIPDLGNQSPMYTLGVASGAGLAMAQLVQAYLRGRDRPLVFVLLGCGVAVAPSVAGLCVVSLGSSSGIQYMSTLAAGQVMIGVTAVAVIFWSNRGGLRLGVLSRSLKIGIPTLPHTLATPLVLTLAVMIASSWGDPSSAGRVQIAAMLGTAPITFLAAVNNAWAPYVYRTAVGDRPLILRRTTAWIAVLAMTLSLAYAVLAPWVLPLIGGPLSSRGAIALSMLVSGSSGFYVAYLANIHLTFIAGRTWPLAITSPLSVMASVFAIIALLNAFPGPPLWTYGIMWMTYHGSQAVFSNLLARRTKLGVVDMDLAMPALAVAVIFPALLAIALDRYWALFGIAVSGILIGLRLPLKHEQVVRKDRR